MERNERESIKKRYYNGLADHLKVASHIGKIRDLCAKPWNLWRDPVLLKSLDHIDKWVKEQEKQDAIRIEAERIAKLG